MRILLIKLALLLLPFVLYALYLAATRHKRTAARPYPGLWLLAAGVALLALALFVVGPIAAGRPGDLYVPDSVVDGKVVPGGFESPDDKDDDGDDDGGGR